MKLPVLEIRKPCQESWEAMERRGSMRHCAACAKDVHDLASMTAREVEALAFRQVMGEEVCARLTRSGDRLVVLPERSPQSPIAVGMALGAAMSVALPAQAQGKKAVANNSAVLKGRMVSADSSQPLHRAVLILSSSTASRLIVLAEDGSFEATTSPGTYDLELSGYGKQVVAAELHAGNQELGTIVVKDVGFESVTTLGEIVGVRIGPKYWLKHPVRFVKFVAFRTRRTFSSN